MNHHKFVDIQRKLELQPSELAQLSNTRRAWQLRSVNVVLDNFPAILECLSAINTPMSVGLKQNSVKSCQCICFFVFQALLSVTACLHRYQQKETIDLAKAVTYKNAVIDSLEKKRSDATVTGFHSRTICEANQITNLEPSSVQRHKAKRMDGYVVESACGAGSEVSGSCESEELKRKLLRCIFLM